MSEAQDIWDDYVVWLLVWYGKVYVGSTRYMGWLYGMTVGMIWKSISQKHKIYGIIIWYDCWYDMEKYMSEAQDIWDDYMVWLLVWKSSGDQNVECQQFGPSDHFHCSARKLIWISHPYMTHIYLKQTLFQLVEYFRIHEYFICISKEQLFNSIFHVDQCP